MPRKIWTVNEETLLRELFREDPPPTVREVWRKHFPDRSYTAVYNKKFKLGLCTPLSKVEERRPTTYRKWGVKEVALLEDLFFNGLSYNDIGKRLGRSESSILHKIVTLNLRRLFPGHGGKLLRPCPQEVLKKLKRWEDEGLPRKKMAEKLGTTLKVVNTLLKSHCLFSRRQKRWKPSDERRLQKLFRKGFKAKEIAEKMGRTDSAIQNRLYRSGMRRRNQWTEKEDKQLRHLLGRGRTHKEIGKVMGRTKNSVSVRCSKLRCKYRGGITTE